MTAKLPREEYVEQAYLFRVLGERLTQNIPMQELFEQTRVELLATTKLPLAVDFMLSELLHSGMFAPAMQRLRHYFAPFQSFLVREAERERGRFDIRIALAVLQREADFRAVEGSPQGLFFFQFETLSCNRLSYDGGLEAMAGDPFYNDDWRAWILEVRRQVGLVDLADLVFIRSEFFRQRRTDAEVYAPADRTGDGADDRSPDSPVEPAILFGEKEGKIALANRRKDPLHFFAALQRHLNYPVVPRPQPIDRTPEQIPQLLRRMERLETRLKLLEEEQRGGLDITRFYGSRPPTPPDWIDPPDSDEPTKP